MSYVPIRVSTLRGDQEINFNVYILINEKHILYIRTGDSFEGSRLKKLKGKKLKRMYIVPDDEELYRAYVDRNLEMAYDDKSGKSIETRAEIVHGHNQANAEAVMENPEDEQAYGLAKTGAGKYVDFLTKKDKGLASVLKLANDDQDLSHHGVTVATLAVGLAQEIGITETKQTELLTLGSLLHDIGHTLHQVPINRPIAEMSEDDLEIYKSHPLIGADLVKNKKHFDQAVISIIMEHEELMDGSGFPQKLFNKNPQDNKIDRLAMVAGIANAYDRLVTFEKVPPKEAMKRMMIEKMGKYPLDMLTGLKKVLTNSGML
jgi:putative nucleotidyltransferase with HDIG domain